ncbi:hypothetical protein PSHT_12147 [Puccinia striiformis]|uniref:Hydrophobin n=2 Tax=Puccinia striiformis TaxID=27350 RepID=A0A2S4UYL1_9BASI|nr:hypothetical protein PSHT_12147 [Puccinia striiformis]
MQWHAHESWQHLGPTQGLATLGSVRAALAPGLGIEESSRGIFNLGSRRCSRTCKVASENEAADRDNKSRHCLLPTPRILITEDPRVKAAGLSPIKSRQYHIPVYRQQVMPREWYYFLRSSSNAHLKRRINLTPVGNSPPSCSHQTQDSLQNKHDIVTFRSRGSSDLSCRPLPSPVQALSPWLYPLSQLHFSNMQLLKSIALMAIIACGVATADEAYHKAHDQVFGCAHINGEREDRQPVCARVFKRKAKGPDADPKNYKVTKANTSVDNPNAYNCVATNMNEAQCCTKDAFSLPENKKQVIETTIDAGIVKDKCVAGRPLAN